MVIGNDTYPQLSTFSSFKIIVVLIFNSFMSNSEILSILYRELTLIAIVIKILSHNVSYHWSKVISILFILITAFFKQGTVVRVPVKLRILIGDFNNTKNCTFSLHCI